MVSFQTYFGGVLVPRGLAVCSGFHIARRFLARIPLCSIFALLFFYLHRWSLIPVVLCFFLSCLACFLFIFGLLRSTRQLCTISSQIYCRQSKD